MFFFVRIAHGFTTGRWASWCRLSSASYSISAATRCGAYGASARRTPPCSPRRCGCCMVSAVGAPRRSKGAVFGGLPRVPADVLLRKIASVFGVVSQKLAEGEWSGFRVRRHRTMRRCGSTLHNVEDPRPEGGGGLRTGSRSTGHDMSVVLSLERGRRGMASGRGLRRCPLCGCCLHGGRFCAAHC